MGRCYRTTLRSPCQDDNAALHKPRHPPPEYYGLPGVGGADRQLSESFQVTAGAVGSLMVRDSPPPSVAGYHASEYSKRMIAASIGEGSFSTISSPPSLSRPENATATLMSVPQVGRTAARV